MHVHLSDDREEHVTFVCKATKIGKCAHEGGQQFVCHGKSPSSVNRWKSSQNGRDRQVGTNDREGLSRKEAGLYLTVRKYGRTMVSGNVTDAWGPDSKAGFLAPAGCLSGKEEKVELTQGTSVAQTRCDSKVPRTKDSTWGHRDSKREAFIRYRRQTSTT